MKIALTILLLTSMLACSVINTETRSLQALKPPPKKKVETKKTDSGVKKPLKTYFCGKTRCNKAQWTKYMKQEKVVVKLVKTIAKKSLNAVVKAKKDEDAINKKAAAAKAKAAAKEQKKRSAAKKTEVKLVKKVKDTKNPKKKQAAKKIAKKAIDTEKKRRKGASKKAANTECKVFSAVIAIVKKHKGIKNACQKNMVKWENELAQAMKDEHTAEMLRKQYRKSRDKRYRAQRKVENKLEELVDDLDWKIWQCEDDVKSSTEVIKVEMKKRQIEIQKRSQESLLAKKKAAAIAKQIASIKNQLKKLEAKLEALNKIWKALRKKREEEYIAGHREANMVEEQIDELTFKLWDLEEDLSDAKALVTKLNSVNKCVTKMMVL